MSNTTRLTSDPSAWQCPWQQVLRQAHSKNIFPSLYTSTFDKGIPQHGANPPRCYPGASDGQWICHTSDIAEVFGYTDVDGYAYNTTNSLPFTQYVMDSWSKLFPPPSHPACSSHYPPAVKRATLTLLATVSFARTHNPQPSPEYLQSRGAAYLSTLQLSSTAPFLAYGSSPNGSYHHFDLPPSNSGPVHSDRCAWYESTGGYTLDFINNAL